LAAPILTVHGSFDPTLMFDHDGLNCQAATDRGRMIKRMVVQTALWLAAMAVLFFVAAGDWRWPQGWVFLGEVAVSTMAVNLWLLRHDPALLESRLSSPMQKDQRPWDRIFLPVSLFVFVSWLVLCALDARRFGWSHVPLWVQAIGAGLIALCMIVVWQVFRFNTFAAPQVRMQVERQQRAITDGPYRIVRHPMYAAALLMFVGTPLLLGSWWGLLFVPIGAVGMGFRAVGEEDMLCHELPGYEEYTRNVRYRMVPGLW
jgi:protein-S-isoprenylcysteine O-methyltransferase Ste14